MSNVHKLLDTLDGIKAEDLESNDLDRLQLIETVKKLLSRVETKEERFFDITLTQPIVFAALQVLINIGLWKQWEEVGGVPKSVDELCELCTKKCDANLLRRLLRLLASVHIIVESSQDQYELTNMCLGNMWHWVQCRTHHWNPACVNLPLFLAKTGYKEPRDTKHTNYADCCPGGLGLFDKCLTEPAYQDSFSGYMRSRARYKVPWPKFFDTTSLVNGSDLSNGRVLCVDIGGHHGTDLARLLDKHPDIPDGSLVLQDLPEVLAGATSMSEKIKPMPHDMFQPQPVKGSRSYFFHAMFHNWSDDAVAKILKKTAEAMERGYSKLLIVDIVLPPTGASAMQSAMDVQMMANFSAHERTEANSAELLSDAGLKIIKIWEDGRRYECLIEAELA
ncbi:putative O-methyltransferase [Nemania serpens]|nr:putative O-methyltransferase [Nemania serpens]